MAKYETGLKIDSGAFEGHSREGVNMNIFRKLFKHKHNWYIKERSNVIQYDDMGYPLRLFLIECTKCHKTQHAWIDSCDSDTDVVCKWYKDIPLPIPPKAEEKLK